MIKAAKKERDIANRNTQKITQDKPSERTNAIEAQKNKNTIEIKVRSGNDGSSGNEKDLFRIDSSKDGLDREISGSLANFVNTVQFTKFEGTTIIIEEKKFERSQKEHEEGRTKSIKHHDLFSPDILHDIQKESCEFTEKNPYFNHDEGYTALLKVDSTKATVKKDEQALPVGKEHFGKNELNMKKKELSDTLFPILCASPNPFRQTQENLGPDLNFIQFDRKRKEKEELPKSKFKFMSVPLTLTPYSPIDTDPNLTNQVQPQAKPPILHRKVKKRSRSLLKFTYKTPKRKSQQYFDLLSEIEEREEKNYDLLCYDTISFKDDTALTTNLRNRLPNDKPNKKRLEEYLNYQRSIKPSHGHLSEVYSDGSSCTEGIKTEGKMKSERISYGTNLNGQSEWLQTKMRDFSPNIFKNDLGHVDSIPKVSTVVQVQRTTEEFSYSSDKACTPGFKELSLRRSCFKDDHEKKEIRETGASKSSEKKSRESNISSVKNFIDAKYI